MVVMNITLCFVGIYRMLLLNERVGALRLLPCGRFLAREHLPHLIVVRFIIYSHYQACLYSRVRMRRPGLKEKCLVHAFHQISRMVYHLAKYESITVYDRMSIGEYADTHFKSIDL